MKKNFIEKNAERKTSGKNVYLLGLLVLGLTGGNLFQYRQSNQYNDAIQEYFKAMISFKQSVLQKIPIYDDYRSDILEARLRSHLLNDHLKIAHSGNFVQISNDKEIQGLVQKGDLVNAAADSADLYYYYNVPNENRFLKPFTLKGLKKLTQEFQKNLPENQNEVKVKLAISSASRPIQYQKNLREKNGNASVESTHSYGISFDIFYDEFYVTANTSHSHILSKRNFDKYKREYGMTLGADLRRQLQTVLSKTLAELQEKGKLYAIFEPNQKCYHVTILPE